MKFLIDTNIVLEIILEQDKADEAKKLLSCSDEYDLYLSDYSLHSIGLLLFRRNQHHVFLDFLSDMILSARVRVSSISANHMDSVVQVAQKFNLDFDDAYQYVTAQRFGLEIVSFDKDFDRTPNGRKTPDHLGV